MNGEAEFKISGITEMRLAVPERGFVYMDFDVYGHYEYYYYDINTEVSQLITSFLSMGFYRAGKIGYESGKTLGGEYNVNLYNIDTGQTQTIPVYRASRDFPQEDYHQINEIYAFIPDGEGYMFLFKVGHHSNSELVLKTLVYQTCTDQAIEIMGYEGYELFEDGVSPSGNYVLLIGEGDETGNGYPIKVIKTADYIQPNTGK